MCVVVLFCVPVLHFFFFNDTATTEIYTLSLHDALPISHSGTPDWNGRTMKVGNSEPRVRASARGRIEIGRAHVELQSRQYLVCRLLLEKKKKHAILLSSL